MSVSLWLSHYNSKAINHIFKCLPFWVDGWSLFSQFTLFSACWDSAVCMGAESSSMPCCLLLYLSATQVPSLLHNPSSVCTFKFKIAFLNFKFQILDLKVQCYSSFVICLPPIPPAPSSHSAGLCALFYGLYFFICKWILILNSSWFYTPFGVRGSVQGARVPPNTSDLRR